MATVGCLSSYDILGELGRGTFGVVNEVRRKRDNKVMVLKQVNLQGVNKDSDRKQAHAEAQIMKQLNSPYIVKCFDAFQEKGRLHIVLEFCERGDLRACLKANQRPWPEKKIWQLLLRVTLGLDYLHTRRILHRDIKSANIFITADDGVRIGDMGLAKQLTNTMSGANTLCGSPVYLSPEQARCTANYTEKCDVWALGVILYELCSDKHVMPFDGSSLPKLFEKIKNEEPADLPRKTPFALRSTCSLLLNKDPELRPLPQDVLGQPVVVESAAKNGLIDLCYQCTSETRDTSEQVPEGVCSKVSACVLGTDGPTVMRHLLAFCEVCAAQGSEDSSFTSLRRRHHCRMCGRSVCAAHSMGRRECPGYQAPARICDICDLLPSGGHSQAGRPWIIAGEKKLHAYDGCNPPSQWSVGEDIMWASLGATPNGTRVLCTLESQPGAQLELRACDRAGTLLHRIAIDEIVPPKKDTQNSPTPSPSTGTAEKRSTTPTKTQIISTKKVDAISCSGSWAAVQRNDKGQTSIQVFELPTGKRLGKLTSTEDTAVAMAVHSGQNGFLCTGGQNGVLRVWSVPPSERQCSLVCMLTGHSDLIIDMAIAGNGAYICSGSKDKTLRLWKRTGSCGEFEANNQAICEDYSPCGAGSVFCHGSQLVFVQAPRAGTWEKGASLWNLALGRYERSFFKRGFSVRCVALHFTVLATSSNSSGRCAVQLWHAPTGTPLSSTRFPVQVTHLILSEEVRGTTEVL